MTKINNSKLNELNKILEINNKYQDLLKPFNDLTKNTNILSKHLKVFQNIQGSIPNFEKIKKLNNIQLPNSFIQQQRKNEELLRAYKKFQDIVPPEIVEINNNFSKLRELYSFEKLTEIQKLLSPMKVAQIINISEEYLNELFDKAKECVLSNDIEEIENVEKIEDLDTGAYYAKADNTNAKSEDLNLTHKTFNYIKSNPKEALYLVIKIIDIIISIKDHFNDYF